MICKSRLSPVIIFLLAGMTFLLISAIVGLSAYLTDVTDPLEMPFKMRLGSEFGISIKSDNYQNNASIAPDQPCDMDLYLSNDGNYDVYAFITVATSDTALSINDIGPEWTILNTDSTQTVYAYGSSDKLTVLPAMTKTENGEFMSQTTSNLCEKVELDPAADYQDGIGVITATGYAIQSDELSTSDPNEVWKMIGSES